MSNSIDVTVFSTAACFSVDVMQLCDFLSSLFSRQGIFFLESFETIFERQLSDGGQEIDSTFLDRKHSMIFQ